MIEPLDKIKDERNPLRDYVLFYLGKAYFDQGKCLESKSIFKDLLENYPESRWAIYAATQVNSDDSCTPLNVSKGMPEDGSDCGDLASQSKAADCFFQSRRYAQAKILYVTLSEKARGKRGLYYLTRLSQSAARTQDFETALWANETLLKSYPRSAAALDALRKIAFLYQDARRYHEAIPALEKVIEQSHSSYEKKSYYERLGWCYFELGDYPKAISSFESGLELIESPFLLYWKGRSLEKLGKKRESREIFAALLEIYPSSYYGLRALDRLGPKKSSLNHWWPSLKRGLQWENKVQTVDSNDDLERASALSSLGLWQEALIEIRRARVKNKLFLPNNPRMIQKTRNGFRFFYRSPKFEDSDYPLPYADFLFSEVKQLRKTIDPFLVYAMMRQESHYRESIISPSGAVGLLQIMPGTGRRLADEAKWDSYHVRWLYEPTANIELSIRYIQKLFNQFGSRWYASVASYNAGEQVVSDWLRARPGMPEEEFIEEIPYAETRDYVKKIYTNWKAYRFIYKVRPSGL